MIAESRTTTLPSEPVGILLSDVKAERVEWIWSGRIARGKVTLIDGDPGKGKSVLSLEVAARLSAGRAWPDGTACPRGGAVILSAEDGLADTIRPRLDAAGGDPTRVVALDLVGTDRHPITLPNDLSYVEQAVQRVDALVVIVDPLTAYLQSAVDMHRDQDVRQALRPLKDLAERLGIGLVVIRHLNKSFGGPVIYRGGGSIGIIGAARIGLVVGVDPEDEGRRVLAPVKSNLSAPPAALAYRLVEASNGAVRVSWDGTSDLTAEQLVTVQTDNQESASLLGEAKTFLQQLLADGPMPAKEATRLADEAGISKQTLRRARETLGVRIGRAGFGKGSQSVWAIDVQKSSYMLNSQWRTSMAPDEQVLPNGDWADTDVDLLDDSYFAALAEEVGS